MEADYLSTGEVARTCGVTRDAVLKWIKKGKLPAVRTPGGHYRVHRADCHDLREARGGESPAPLALHRDARDHAPARCWEYFAEGGAPREACRNCLVFLARAQRCFRLAELGKNAGHQLHFCRTDCRTCAFYRACQGLATEVLVISPDEALALRIQEHADPLKISVRVARSGYEASAIISTFSPALIVVDSAIPEATAGRLPASVLEDERIPGALVAVALRGGDPPPVRHERLLFVTGLITEEEIERLASTADRILGRAPRDVA